MDKLNSDQQLAYQKLVNFINSDSKSFLLLGSAGSGKTTVIINFFAETSLKIAFCAFTNKATQVLRKTAKKFNIKFSVSFGTIHQILGLRPYLDEIGDLKFLYQKNYSKIKDYDIVIFDECSCISKELLFYITDSKPEKTKLIFLGDNWQLPPINEELSKTFHYCGSNKAILKKIMRSTNTYMELINTNLQEYITHFKNNDLDKLQEFILNIHTVYFTKHNLQNL